MDILQLPDNEPFAVGLNVPVQFPLGELRRLENFTLLFIIQGTARVELDFRDYTLHPDSYLGLGAEQFFQCLEASPDFEVSYLTIPSNVLFEVTTRFDPAFLAFFRQYPLSPVLTPDKRKEMRLMLEVSYHLYEEREHTFRLPMFKNCLQNSLMDIYDKTKAQFLHHRSGNTTRQEELLEKFIHLVFQHCSTRRDVQFYADQLQGTDRRPLHPGNQDAAAHHEPHHAGDCPPPGLPGPVLLQPLLQEEHGDDAGGIQGRAALNYPNNFIARNK